MKNLTILLFLIMIISFDAFAMSEESVLQNAQTNTEDTNKKDDITKEEIKREENSPASLFFKENEFSAITETISNSPLARKEIKENDEEAKENIFYSNDIQTTRNIFLSSIIHFSERNWILWINGKKITPLTRTPSFVIYSVTPKYIEIAIKTVNSISEPFKLYANQTYIVSTGQIFEGKK